MVAHATATRTPVKMLTLTMRPTQHSDVTRVPTTGLGANNNNGDEFVDILQVSEKCQVSFMVFGLSIVKKKTSSNSHVFADKTKPIVFTLRANKIRSLDL